MNRNELKKLKADSHQLLRLHIRRSDIFMDSYHQLKGRQGSEMKGKLNIHFIGEEGADAGGLTREWFLLLSKEMFNPDIGLFKLSANGDTYQPNPKSAFIDSNHLNYFQFIGRIIGKALHDGCMLDCFFTRSFYKIICGKRLLYTDMEDYDPEYFKNLKWLLETDISGMGDFLSFRYVYVLTG